MSQFTYFLVSAMLLTVVYAGGVYYFVLRKRVTRSADLIQKMAPLLLAVFGSAVGLVTFVGTRDRSHSLVTELGTYTLAKDIEELGARVSGLEKALAAAATTGSGGTASQQTVAQIASLKASVSKTADAISKFEALLMTEAERLITLPLLQRDIRAFREDLSSSKESVAGLSELLAETNGQNRWVIGTLALGMLALVLPAARSFLPGSGRDEREVQKEA